MIKRHRPPFADDILERYRFDTITTRRDHNTENTIIYEVGTGCAQTCGKQAISRRRRPAALQVPQYGEA
jgi:hypothetical protein